MTSSHLQMSTSRYDMAATIIQVLLLTSVVFLCNSSPSYAKPQQVETPPCQEDSECPVKEGKYYYCHYGFCERCYNCTSDANRKPSPTNPQCAKELADCGACLQGYEVEDLTVYISRPASKCLIKHGPDEDDTGRAKYEHAGVNITALGLGIGFGIALVLLLGAIVWIVMLKLKIRKMKKEIIKIKEEPERQLRNGKESKKYDSTDGDQTEMALLETNPQPNKPSTNPTRNQMEEG